MHLSVVIPTHRRPADLRRLLASIVDQDLGAFDFEVIVVSNLQDIPTTKVIETARASGLRLHYMVAGAVGVNRARNLGLASAQASIALFVDDDCVLPHRQFLRHHLEAHQKHPEAAAIGGAYIAPLDASDLEIAYNLICTKWLYRTISHTGRTLNLVGGNVSYKVNLIKERNLSFCESIAFGGAETEFHHRLVREGLNLHFDPKLSLEHRAGLSPYSLLRKAFLQGFSAQRRWENGLFFSSTPSSRGFYESGSPEVQFWERSFHLVFSLGQSYASKNGEGPILTSRLAALLIGLAGKEIKTRSRNFAKRLLSRWLRWRSGGEIETALPLDRFFVLPVSENCSHDCSYCPSLGFRRISENRDVVAELQRAKRFGFRDVLLPCNAYSSGQHQEFARRIRESGLKPHLLLNGDATAPMPIEELGKLAKDGWGFHVLLAEASAYQSSLLKALQLLKVPFSLTLFYELRDKTIGAFERLPKILQERVHYLFPLKGTFWHSKPSSLQINQFIHQLARRLPSSRRLVVRGSAGTWPVNQVADPNREVWPLQEPVWQEAVESSAKIEFSIVIPTYNSSEHLLKAVKQIGQLDFDHQKFEVIIVDDGSQDQTLERLRSEWQIKSWPSFSIKYFYWPKPQEGPQFRAGLARNLGVSASRGEYLCFLDSDILIPRHYLSDLKELLGPYDVIQAKREMLTDAASREFTSLENIDARSIYPDEPYWEDFKSVEKWTYLRLHWKYTCTYALSLKRSLFDKAGWFAPEFFTYGFEDTDLGYRLNKLGAKFHFSGSPVYHLFPSRNEFNFHFDNEKRNEVLTLSCRVFHRLRLDPEIFYEFYPSFVQPLSGEVRIALGWFANLDWVGWTFVWLSRLKGRLLWCRGKLLWCHGKLLWCRGKLLWCWGKLLWCHGKLLWLQGQFQRLWGFCHCQVHRGIGRARFVYGHLKRYWITAYHQMQTGLRSLWHRSLKPYHFLSYQYQKRILKRVVSAEMVDAQTENL